MKSTRLQAGDRRESVRFGAAGDGPPPTAVRDRDGIGRLILPRRFGAFLDGEQGRAKDEGRRFPCGGGPEAAKVAAPATTVRNPQPNPQTVVEAFKPDHGVRLGGRSVGAVVDPASFEPPRQVRQLSAEPL